MQFRQIQRTLFSTVRVMDHQDGDTLKHLEDTVQGWTQSWFVYLRWEGLAYFMQPLSQIVFRQGIHQQRQTHHHDQSHGALGGLQEESVGKEQQGAFQNRKPSLGWSHSLTFVGHYADDIHGNSAFLGIGDAARYTEMVYFPRREHGSRCRRSNS